MLYLLRSEAYFCLGLCYDISDLSKEAVQHYEMAIERRAFVTVIGRMGDDRIVNPENDCTNNWTNTVYTLMLQYLSEEFIDREKPTWYCQDAILKRIVKLVKDTVYADVSSSDDEKMQASLFVAYPLSGVVSGGIVHQGDSIPDDKTPEDLIEAAVYLSRAETMPNMERVRSDYKINRVQ